MLLPHTVDELMFHRSDVHPLNFVGFEPMYTIWKSCEKWNITIFSQKNFFQNLISIWREAAGELFCKNRSNFPVSFLKIVQKHIYKNRCDFSGDRTPRTDVAKLPCRMLSNELLSLEKARIEKPKVYQYQANNTWESWFLQKHITNFYLPRPLSIACCLSVYNSGWYCFTTFLCELINQNFS